MNKSLKSLMKAIDNPYVSVAEEGVSAGSSSTFINTGSYVLNAVISGSIFGGAPSNKVTMFAGEPSTGKTFFSLSMCKNFLDSDENALVFYLESEGAISKEMLESRGIDTSRFVIVEVATAEQFKNNGVQLLDEYAKTPIDDRPPAMMVLDSLGMLSTEKETKDASEGNNTRDMTRAQVLKGAFRTLTLKMSRLQVPMIVVNHVYDAMDMYSPKVVGGGKGSQYAASTIITLSKSKAVGADAGGGSADKSRVGSIIRCTATKSRLTIENSFVRCLLLNASGLDPYFGLFDLAKEAGMFEKSGTRWRNTKTDQVLWAKDILDPKKAPEVFTQEFLEELDEFVKEKFCYGAAEGDASEFADETDSE